MGLDTPDNFDFPFEPYPIQHDFMKHLYEAIENKKLGIFESPTGTGKSLSIICGALRWLKDHNEEERLKLMQQIEALEEEKLRLSGDSSDWLSSQSQEIEITQKLGLLKIRQNEIARYDKKIKDLQCKKKVKPKKLWAFASQKDGGSKPANSEAEADNAGEDAEEDLLLDDVIPEYEGESSDEEEENKYEPIKILICSRTHSQLSQLVGEIIKSPFGKETRVISLASRQNYCINPAVKKLKNVSLINERCLDMQNKSKSKVQTDQDGKVVKRQKGTSCQCPYFKQQNIENLRELALSDIQDMEDLVTEAKQLNACPYYASRKAAEDAQVVLVPYNTLLHRSTRKASGIKVKNNVIIIDEAHNLLEALAQMYSAEINLVQLEEAQKRLRGYKNKYSKRFSSYNLLCINQLLFIITNLIKCLNKNGEPKNEVKTETYTIENFVLSSAIDNYNMFKLIKFCKDSRISQKIHSFATRFPQDLQVVEKKEKHASRAVIQKFLSDIQNKKNVKPTVQTEEKPPVKPQLLFGNPFLSFISFMEALTHSYKDGRIIIHRNQDKKLCKLNFLLLNPAAQFGDIVQEARSVIVAGGTMKPISEFRERLFMSAGAAAHSLAEFSCDHIIPPQNILPLVVTKSLNQEDLLFNFENRFSMGKCIKDILREVSRLVKGGIVVFFPSYKYESWLWQQVQGMNFGRPVYREPQDSASTEAVLDSYAAAIRKPNSNGAMLFSVVGGKLSEGLNFSDDLGRCIIVIGLPYANINSPELKEKMLYLDNTEGKGAGKRFYESLCMKSVNQCIGRAVRHCRDYACVLLLDLRYNRAGTQDALPGWIKRSLGTCSFKEALVRMEKFFQERKQDS